MGAWVYIYEGTDGRCVDMQVDGRWVKDEGEGMKVGLVCHGHPCLEPTK